MNKLLTRLQDEKRMKGFIIWYYIIGFAGMVFPLTRPFFELLMGLSVMITFTVILLFHQPWNFRFLAAALGVYACGFLVELLGVQTGIVFGHYKYGVSMGPRWLDTPWLIGVNWLMLIYTIHLLLQKVKLPAAIGLSLGAAMMTAYDVLLEPVAIAWKMWEWNGTSVPYRNYIAWFVISLLFLLLFRSLKVQLQNRIAIFTLVVQAVFLAFLNLVLFIT